jgi:hypothetical protein
MEARDGHPPPQVRESESYSPLGVRPDSNVSIAGRKTGLKRTGSMSAFGGKADIAQTGLDVCF